MIPAPRQRKAPWLPGRGWLLAFGAMPLPAHAEPLPTVQLEVHRGPGAEDCPDAHRLRHLLAQSGAQPVDGEVTLQVRFLRTGEGHEASVQASGVRSGVRSLAVRDGHCGPLAEALAVSIALLLDPDAAPAGAGDAPATSLPETHAELDTAPSAPPHTAYSPLHAVTPPGDPAGSAGSTVQGRLDITPTFALGFTPDFTAGAEAGFSVRWSWGSARLGASAFLPRDTPFAGGRVDGFLMAGRTSLCADWALSESALLGTCATGLAGRLRVAGSGFEEDRVAVRPLFAAGPEITLMSGAVESGWGWVLQGAPLFLARKESFFVEGEEGHAFRVAPVSVWLGAGIWSRIW